MINKEIYELAKKCLMAIKAPAGFGIYASTGHNYQYAIFGRDSLEVGQDILFSNGELVREILIFLARLQGMGSNNLNEEELGKIHHEYRFTKMGDTIVSDESKKIIKRLSTIWGGEDGKFCYFGSIDSTPLFVRLAGLYVMEYGAEILNEQITDIHGNNNTFINHVRLAAEWVKDKVESSPWSLLEFKRANPKGLPYQAWKDSNTGYLHLDGVPANFSNGIASIEVQGYAYDALVTTSKLFAKSADESKQYRDLASKLQKNTLELLWMKDEKFFAIGLDRDDVGTTRQIKTLTSNAAAVLDSELLINLPNEDRMGYVEPIMTKIMGKDFLTDVGIRTRSLKHQDLCDYADYHGCLVSWPKETYNIARGLRRHGYVDQATDLENRLLSAVKLSKEFYEFYYVDASGYILYDYKNIDLEKFRLHGKLNIPESCQAWTVSAIIGILFSRQY